MHSFFAHPKTKPCAACSLRCCGNKFANRIPRSTHRKGHTAQRMRRYLRHVEQQATRHEIQAQLREYKLDQDRDFLERAAWQYGVELHEERRIVAQRLWLRER